jgi:hypothetical protein
MSIHVCRCAWGVCKETFSGLYVYLVNLSLYGMSFSTGWGHARPHGFCFPTVYARDRGSPPLLTHVTVRVAVEDENDHAPTFGNVHLSLEVPEGQDPQTLTTLRASDPDVGANGQLQYRILGENHPIPTNPALTCLVLVPCLPLLVSVNVYGSLFPLFLCLLHFFSCIHQDI